MAQKSKLSFTPSDSTAMFDQFLKKEEEEEEEEEEEKRRSGI